MLNKSKLCLAVLGLSLSGVGYTGMYAPPPAPTCTPGDVTVPCEEKKWDLRVRGLILRSLYDADAAYSTVNVNNFAPYVEVDNEWGWGYRIDGSYHYRTGSDITMNWTHYDKDYGRAGLQNQFNPTPANPQAVANVTYTVQGNNTFDQVNLIFGQHVDMGLLKNARFYAGVQYARIRAEANSYFVYPLVPNNYRRYLFSDAKGWGAVAGIDYSYDITPSFSILANGAASVLYGNSRYSQSFIVLPASLVTYAGYATQRVTLPSLEAQLGLNYSHEIAMGTLSAEVGYQALNYFNALQTRGTTGLGVLTNTDFGLYGPYIGLHWLGHA